MIDLAFNPWILHENSLYGKVIEIYKVNRINLIICGRRV